MSEAGASVPGERLRAERERRGFSAQKVAEQLHVDVWVVEALESGRHASLGAPVFVKGHLRKYATLLGLDAEALVSACAEQQDPPLVLLRPAVRRRRAPRIPVKSLLIGAAVLLVAAAGVWGYRLWRDRPQVPAPTPSTSTQAPVAAASVLVAAPAAEAVAAPSEDPPAERSPTTVQPAEPGRPTTNAARAASGQTMRVRLSFSADSWVELYDADQRRVFFDLGVANSARSFTVAAPARVFLGYADAVQLELDGEPVTLNDEVRRGNVAHFTLDSRGRLKPAGSLSGR